ncbi:MAG: YgiT-type zinc finger protein [Anaerolineales bacterium]|jgi:YgiT-type zinc finger domain-containing protein
MERRPFYPCPECQVGSLQPRQASYFTTLEGQLVCAPDFPAWVCDMCGRREYDSGALAELQALLATDRRSRNRRRGAATGGGDALRTHTNPLRRP